MNIEFDVTEIEDAFNDFYPSLSFSEDFILQTLNDFEPYFTERQLIKYMRIACDKTDNADSAIRYFCGICWNRIKNPYPEPLVEKQCGAMGKPSKPAGSDKNLH